MLRQITYISSARGVHSAQDLAAIEAESQRLNAASGLSGILLFDGKRYLQVLEGPSEVLDATYARIAADTRHRALVMLRDVPCAVPHFPGWAMLARDVTRDDHDLKPLLAPFLQTADRSTHALFSSFVEIRGRAAA